MLIEANPEKSMSPRQLLAELAQDLRPQSKASRALYIGSGFWLAMGLVEVAPLASDSWNWSGSVSWRKPIVFAVSVGLLMATIGWVLDRLPHRPRLAASIAWTFLVSASLEVGLITLQTSRGRASHFNTLEAGDAVVFGIMGAAVGVMSLAIVAVFIWSAVERPRDPLVRLAVLAGLGLVITGLGLGQWIIQLGVDYVEANNVVPETVIAGEAGVAKFPHAIALHGIQLFIVAALLLGRSGLTKARVRKLWTVIVSYSMVLALVSLQTIAGRPIVEISAFPIAIVISTVVLIVQLLGIVRSRLADRPTEPLTLAERRVDKLPL